MNYKQLSMDDSVHIDDDQSPMGAPKMRLSGRVPDGPELGIEYAYLPGQYRLGCGWKWADGKPSWEGRDE